MGWMVGKEKLDESQRNIVKAIVGQNHNLFIHGPAGSESLLFWFMHYRNI